ncbi:MAG: acetolactate decarboxylase [Bacteroidales bacterium]|nr:acetolactate decarboxylase [Bacteroidales bacterium]
MKKIAIFLSLIFIAGCTQTKQQEENEAVEQTDCLYQISTIQALIASDFHGVISVEELLQNGDFGIGTFEGVAGEMIVLDGVCYQALADGSVKVVDNAELVPFSAVTWFKSDISSNIKGEYSFEDLKAELDGIVNENGANSFYAMRIDGRFPEMKVRSIKKQQEPYMTLDEVTKRDQVVFDYTNETGTLIAFYCPSYASGVNASGWHMHFLSQDKQRGGHILGFKMSEGAMQLDRKDDFYMRLPDSDYFNNLDLNDLENAVNKVEKGK